VTFESDLNDLRKVAKVFGVLAGAEKALASALTAEQAEKQAKNRLVSVRKDLDAAEGKLRDTLDEVAAQMADLDKLREAASVEAARLRDEAERTAKLVDTAARSQAKDIVDAATAREREADAAVAEAKKKVRELDGKIAEREAKLAEIREAIAKVMG
jgi:chromosome segregation ATPase